ncbi:MAG: glycosyltransferase, partial [Actinomycetota bacterium]
MVATLAHVEIGSFDPRRFESVLSPERFSEFLEAVDRAATLFAGRRIWNVNSTARGGGVAEMLRSLLAYAQGAGVDARWVVIEGSPDFFRVTKRIHNHLHGSPGDGRPLGPQEHEIYGAALEPNAEALARIVEPKDVVILHDPQTAGLIDPMKECVAIVLWRCHVGLDTPNEIARHAWRFLDHHVGVADAHIFSRQNFVWEGLDSDKTAIIPPSIDAFSPKNQELEPRVVRAILAATGLTEERPGDEALFIRHDGTPSMVARATTFADDEPPPPDDAKIVTQVSRWDRLKDPLGVIEGFARHVAPELDSHLVVAGPAVEAVSDDPEGAEVLEEARLLWSRLDPAVR